jgi:hypothetical protein
VLSESQILNLLNTAGFAVGVGEWRAENGVQIHDRDEMLCLTDMWKAQGAVPAQQPANWLASAEAKSFMEALNDLNPGNSGVKAKKGKNGGTYAHWQIGLAYAKYLSPEFHMWCNTVVRERMEGKPAAVAITDIAQEVRKVIGGIMKTVVHAELANVLPALIQSELSAKTHALTKESLTAGQVLDMEKVPAKGRRGLVVRTANGLRKFCERHSIVPREVQLGNTARAYVYPVEIVHRWLHEEGRGMIRSRLSAMSGQRVLPFRDALREEGLELGVMLALPAPEHRSAPFAGFEVLLQDIKAVVSSANVRVANGETANFPLALEEVLVDHVRKLLDGESRGKPPTGKTLLDWDLRRTGGERNSYLNKMRRRVHS